MALIKCPECGKQISEYAPSCISCGCPMDKIKELLNKKTAKNRNAQVNKNVSVVKQEKNIDSKSFYEKRTNKEKQIIDLVLKLLENVFKPLHKADGKFTYYIGEGTQTNHINYCWFANGDNNELLFKYHKGTGETNYAEKITIYNYDVCVKKALALIYNDRKKGKPIIQKSEINKSNINGYEFVCAQMLNYFKNGKVSSNAKIKELSKNVYDYFEKNSRVAKFTLGNFNRKKYYFDTLDFTLKTITTSDIKYIYASYKANKIIELVQKYEKVFGCKIICDYSSFKNEIIDMALNRDIKIFKCKNINSSISKIPEQTLENLVISFSDLENN